MPVETASDLASMFDDDEFAAAAQYSPPGGGGPVSCLVVVDRGQGRRPFDAGKRDVEGSERKLWARAAELPAIARDGTFAMLDAAGLPTGEVYTVAGLPVLDQIGALWSVDLLIAA